MSSWYKTGTITVTNGSTTVTGSGTQWILNAQVGEALYAPDGRLYEITNISSDTAFTIAPAYLGATAAGQAYVIVPSQSYIRDLAAQAADLVNQYSTIAAFAGQGKFGDGTLSAPGIRYSDDLDTGFFRSDTNEVTFVAGGVAQFKYNASGLVFTGATSAVNLSYTGTLTGGTGVINIGSGQVFKDASGNVGIGTASPTQKLDVAGVVKFGFTSAPTWDTSSYLWSEGGVGLNVEGFNLKFNTGNARNERLRIDSSGNVGIGTSTPSVRLDVAGAATLTNATYCPIEVNSSTIKGQLAANAGGTVEVRAVSNHPLAFFTNNAERARIDSSGNLLLGGTSTPGAKVFYIANATTVPASNPSDGGVLYVEGGALKYRGSSGTVTTIANA